MKIAVVGCGALGSFYGAKLWQSGAEVHFLLRSDYEVVRARGVLIHSGGGRFIARPVAARNPAGIGICDVVIIGLKTTANGCFGELLPPLIGPHTLVVTLQNGLGNEEALAERFAPAQILGGLCFVCLNRVAPGEVRHLGEGRVVLGEFSGPARPGTRELAARFQSVGVACAVTDDLARAHWEKLVWNIPFNGLGVAGVAGWEALASGRVPETLPRQRCLPTDELLGDERWCDAVRALMVETVRGAAALGHEVPPELPEKMIRQTRGMGRYAASTLVDFERGQPLELESLFHEPLRRARRAGAALPTLERLCAVLDELDRRRLRKIERAVH